MPASKTIAAILYWAAYFIARNFGYSQPNRWSGLKGGKPSPGGDFDCTSIIGAILYLAGCIPRALISGTWYSGNLAAKLAGVDGWRRVSAKGKSLAWLTANVTAGCVLIGPGHGVLGLGGGWVLSWEYSENGTAKGKLGRQSGERVGKRKLYLRSRGWTDLLVPPADPKPVAAVTALSLRAAQASLEAAHFGGPTDYAAIGRKLGTLGASLIGCTETTVTAKGKTAWSGRAAIQKAIGKGWARVAFLALCLFYPTGKYERAGKVRTVQFAKGDIWHGAMIVPLTRRDAKTRIDAGVVHIRPQSVATDAQKRADVAAVLALVDPGVPTILMGDWAGSWDAELLAAGFVRGTAKLDSYDDAGNQYIDAVYLSHDLAGDVPKDLDPGKLSDHRWLSVRVRKASTAV